MNETDLKEIHYGATRIFCNGIYVKSNAHPCCWDFISFEDIEEESDMWKVPIGLWAISNGNYDTHEYENLTVKEILNAVGKDWCFERSGINWD